jgi:hypothetical protein
VTPVITRPGVVLVVGEFCGSGEAFELGSRAEVGSVHLLGFREHLLKLREGGLSCGEVELIPGTACRLERFDSGAENWPELGEERSQLVRACLPFELG